MNALVQELPETADIELNHTSIAYLKNELRNYNDEPSAFQGATKA
jgi:hypothetical protein